MSRMDNEIRILIEEIIDRHIKSPETEKGYQDILISMGIEPSLETTLAFISGTCFRAFIEAFIRKHGRRPTGEETDPFVPLLKRRAWELRQVYLTSRFKT